MVAVVPAPAPDAPDRRARLAALAARVRPPVPAHDRMLAVAPPLGGLLPGGGVARGATVAVSGELGAGATWIGLALAASATAGGEWAAAIDLHGTLGALAARDVGVELERFAVVRHVPADRWPTVVAALLDGMAVVVAAMPARVRAGDAHRLVARARERGAVLVACGPWPVEAALRIRARASEWATTPAGLLGARGAEVHVEGRGAPARGWLRPARAG